MADNYSVLDGNGASRTFKATDAGSVLTPHHHIDSLPAAVVALISASKDFLETLATATVASSTVPADTAASKGFLETLASGTAQADIAASKAFLETLAGAILSASMKVVLQAGSEVIGKLADNAGVNIGTVDLAAGAAATPSSTRLSTGAAFYDAANSGQLPTIVGPTSKAGSLSVTYATDDPALALLGPAAAIYDGSKNVTTAGTRVVLAASQVLTKGVRVRAKDANAGLIYIGGAAVSSSSDRLTPGEATWMDVNNFALIWIDAAISGEGVTFCGW